MSPAPALSTSRDTALRTFLKVLALEEELALGARVHRLAREDGRAVHKALDALGRLDDILHGWAGHACS